MAIHAANTPTQGTEGRLLRQSHPRPFLNPQSIVSRPQHDDFAHFKSCIFCCNSHQNLLSLQQHIFQAAIIPEGCEVISVCGQIWKKNDRRIQNHADR
jgi:hypothetical protein